MDYMDFSMGYNFSMDPSSWIPLYFTRQTPKVIDTHYLTVKPGSLYIVSITLQPETPIFFSVLDAD